MDSEVPFTNLLRCNHHWPFCHALTLTRLTLTNLTLIPLIMRILTILFPVIRYGRPREPGPGWSCMISLVRVG